MVYLAAGILSKKGTPTMGGLLIVTVLVFSDDAVDAMERAGGIDAARGFGFIGSGDFYDDYAKIPPSRAAAALHRASSFWCRPRSACLSAFIF